jgi:Arc/MetJ family transcription regulator
MRTTINVDDKLMKVVMQETKAATKTEAIRRALEAFVRRRNAKAIIALKGKVKFDAGWKTLRKEWSRNLATTA